MKRIGTCERCGKTKLMAFAKHYQRTSKPEPGDTVRFCPLCGIEIWVTRGPVGVTGQELEMIEMAVEKHLATYHRFRYWAWRALGSVTRPPLRWLVTGLGS